MFSRVLVFVDIFSCQHMSEIVRMAALHGAVKMAKPLTKWYALTLMNTLSICWAKTTCHVINLCTDLMKTPHGAKKGWKATFGSLRHKTW